MRQDETRRCGYLDEHNRSSFVVRRSAFSFGVLTLHDLGLGRQFFLQLSRYTMNLVEHWIDRSASCWARKTRSGEKCPRSTPSLRESFVSIVDATENSTKRALSAGRNRPKPSAMFLVDDEADARIWSRNSKCRMPNDEPAERRTPNAERRTI